MKFIETAGTTNFRAYIFIQDTSASDGSGLTGLVYDSAGLVCYYVRPGTVAAQLALVTQTVTGAHTDGGFVEISAANMPGVYRLDFSDIILGINYDSVVVMLKGAANMASVVMEIQLESNSFGEIFGLCSDIETDTNSIETKIDALPAAIASNIATSGIAVDGTVDANTYAATALNDGTYWQISPDAGGLTVEPKFLLGTATKVSHITVNGYFDANPQRFVNCYAYNYHTAVFDQITDSGNRMNNENTDQDYGPWILTPEHQKATDGEVHLRFASTSTTVGDDLFLDQIIVWSAATGYTLNEIADAVASHNVVAHADHLSLGYHVSISTINQFNITSVVDASNFTMALTESVDNYYAFHNVRIHDVTNDRKVDSWILSHSAAGVVVLGRALPFTPDTNSEVYILDGQADVSELRNLHQSGTVI